MSEENRAQPGEVFGRYALYDVIASGGMASVHFAQQVGAAGFARTVAVKRLHPHLAHQPEFVAMFLNEARLAARVQHSNVIPTLDVVSTQGELLLVMEYVQGESLSRLLRPLEGQSSAPLNARLASPIMAGVLSGLHAAHEARGADGEPLELIHRDVSPHNILVGVDGVARLLDFGIAKANVRLQQTAPGKVKGKLAYLAPEQLRGKPISRRTDIYSASVVLWEALAGRRLYEGRNDGEIIEQVMMGVVQPPSRYAPGLPGALDDVTLQGLAQDPDLRFATAADMALALQRAQPGAHASEIGAWVCDRAGPQLNRRARRIAEIEGTPKPSIEPNPAGTADVRLLTARAKRIRATWVALTVVGLATAGAWVWRASRARLPASEIADPFVAPTPPATAAAIPAAPPAVAPKSPRAPTRRPSTRQCEPPYVRDAAGRIHWKLECL